MSGNLSLPPFHEASVLVVGDVMLDRYWSGPSERLSPEAPVPVVRVEHCTERPGGAANVAMNMAALGARVSLFGACGDDPAGHSVRDSLAAGGVDSRVVYRAGCETTVKLRVLAQHQQLLRLDFEPPSDAGFPIESLPGPADLTPPTLLLLSDYGKGVLSDPAPLVRQARARGMVVLVDPSGTDFNRYRGASWITPNLTELRAVVGDWSSEPELASNVAALQESTDIEHLLLTRGASGMTLYRRGHAALHLPARAREVFDVTGAGDTVIAVLAAALGGGSDADAAVMLANLAAAASVGRLGASTVSAPELAVMLQREQGVSRGVVSREQLPALLDMARNAGERIVFTNGCFDILHAGHVAYLEQARQCGDRLVVALNTDESVHRLKGAGRPLNSLDQRLCVVAALQSVDWVVAFSEDTPETLLRELRPDLLVKGGDYRRDEVVGADIVEAYGGAVRVLDLHDSLSTSAIIRQLDD